MIIGDLIMSRLMQKHFTYRSVFIADQNSYQPLNTVYKLICMGKLWTYHYI